MTELSDDELDRYARHIVLPQIGGVGQRRLKAASVAIVGAGGIGSAGDPGAGRRGHRHADDHRRRRRRARPICSASRSSATIRSGSAKATLAAEFVERPQSACRSRRRSPQRLDRRQCRRAAGGPRPRHRRQRQFRDPAGRRRHAALGSAFRWSPPPRRSSRARSALFRGWEAASPATAASSATRSTPTIATPAPSWACSERSTGDRRQLRRADGDPRDRRHRRGRGRQPVPVRRRRPRLAEDPPAAGPGCRTCSA